MSFYQNFNLIDLFMVASDSIQYSNNNYLSLLFFINYWLVTFFYTISDFFILFSYKTTIVNSVFFTIKFMMLIALLVAIRGGVPRYRYDFLTKLGWIKFLSLVLSVFLSSLLLVYLF